MSQSKSPEEVIEIASKELGHLCDERWAGRDGWHWEIPANPERDTDLRIGNAIGLAKDLLAENKRLREALSIYARRYDENKWCWNWIETDGLNGPIHEFDWKGEEQDEPWEVAEKALAALHPQPETQGGDKG